MWQYRPLLRDEEIIIQLKELIYDNNIDTAKIYMSMYKSRVNIPKVIYDVRSYEMFLVILGDLTIDNEMLKRILKYIDYGSIIFDFLIKYNIDPILLITTYTNIYHTVYYNPNIIICPHRTIGDKCTECLKDLDEYKIVIYIISKYDVSIDKLKERCCSTLLEDILDNLPDDV